MLKSFPLWFLDTKVGKTAYEHKEIISYEAKSNEKLGKGVLMFSGTSDNEISVALGVYLFLNFSGSVRCISHSLSLAVNESTAVGDFLDDVLRRIDYISNYGNHRLKVGTKLVQLQCHEFGRDSIVTLDKPFSTRWH